VKSAKVGLADRTEEAIALAENALKLKRQHLPEGGSHDVRIDEKPGDLL
jgi:hypothetical protein